MKLNIRHPLAAMGFAASLSCLPAASAGWIDDSPMCMLRCTFLPGHLTGSGPTIEQPPIAAAPAVPAAVAATIREHVDQAISDLSCRWYGAFDAAGDQIVQLGRQASDFVDEANRWAEANRPLESLDQWVVPQIAPAEAIGPQLANASADEPAIEENATVGDFDLLEPHIAASAAACGEIWIGDAAIDQDRTVEIVADEVPIISLPSRDAIANFIVRMPIELPVAAAAAEPAAGVCCPAESLVQPERDPHEMFAANILPRLDLSPPIPSLAAGTWRNAKQVTIKSKLLFIEESVAGEIPTAASPAPTGASTASAVAAASPAAESSAQSGELAASDDAVRLLRTLRGWIHSADQQLAALEHRCVRAAAAGGKLAR